MKLIDADLSVSTISADHPLYQPAQTSACAVLAVLESGCEVRGQLLQKGRVGPSPRAGAAPGVQPDAAAQDDRGQRCPAADEGSGEQGSAPLAQSAHPERDSRRAGSWHAL